MVEHDPSIKRQLAYQSLKSRVVELHHLFTAIFIEPAFNKSHGSGRISKFHEDL